MEISSQMKYLIKKERDDDQDDGSPTMQSQTVSSGRERTKTEKKMRIILYDAWSKPLAFNVDTIRGVSGIQ